MGCGEGCIRRADVQSLWCLMGIKLMQVRMGSGDDDDGGGVRLAVLG